TEHHERGPPPPIEGFLRHGLLLGRTLAAQMNEQVVALTLVEGLLLTDADHGPCVGTIRAAAQRNLVDDGSAIHQPADHADVGPRERGVIEDAGILSLACVQSVYEIVARDA